MIDEIRRACDRDRELLFRSAVSGEDVPVLRRVLREAIDQRIALIQEFERWRDVLAEIRAAMEK